MDNKNNKNNNKKKKQKKKKKEALYAKHRVMIQNAYVKRAIAG